MKYYTIEAKSPAECEEILQKMGQTFLLTNLEIRHKQTPGSCPTEVRCVVKNGNDLVNKKKGLEGGLLVMIDEEEPKIMANNCYWGYVDIASQFAAFIFGCENERMLVTIYFKGHSLNTAF